MSSALRLRSLANQSKPTAPLQLLFQTCSSLARCSTRLRPPSGTPSCRHRARLAPGHHSRPNRFQPHGITTAYHPFLLLQTHYPASFPTSLLASRRLPPSAHRKSRRRTRDSSSADGALSSQSWTTGRPRLSGFQSRSLRSYSGSGAGARRKSNGHAQCPRGARAPLDENGCARRLSLCCNRTSPCISSRSLLS